LQVVSSTNFDQAIAPITSATSVTIGNFDGFHLGHQKLIAAAKAPPEDNLKSLLVTFNPHPAEFFRNATTPLLLSPELKRQAAKELGLDIFFEQAFTKGFAELTPQHFFEQFILTTLNCRRVAVGHEFRFGKDRLGDRVLLEEMCQKKGISLSIIDEKRSPADDKVISSSLIRHLVREQGQVGLAQTLLGRPYLLAGNVAKGKQLGRTIDLPTLNLTPKESRQIVPQNGVYCGFVWLEGYNEQPGPKVFADLKTLLPAVINIGVKPSVSAESSPTSIEAHILNHQLAFDSCYGLTMGLYFCERLRSEKKFPNLTALKQAIVADISQAQTILDAAVHVKT